VYLFLHGGGYCSGSKEQLPPVLRDALLAGGISVAAANYRFTDDPELFAPLHDGEYAVQFLRQHAADFRIDPARVAAGGGSAGAATACWLAFRPDAADPDSADPRARQSTRLQCLAAWEAQTTLDPLDIRRFVAGPTWTIASIQALCQLTLDQYDTPEAHARFRKLSFLDMVDAAAPPTFLYNLTPDLPLTDELPIGPGIHHPIFGRELKTRMDQVNIECVLRTYEQEQGRLPDAEIDPLFQREFAGFVIRHLCD
jgi:acetyl esterase/lipase